MNGRRLEENRSLIGGGLEQAIKLIGEARQVGLIDSSTQIDYQNHKEIFSLLMSILNWTPQMISSENGIDRLMLLQNRLLEIRNEYDNIESNIKNACSFADEAFGYSDEATYKKSDLNP